VAVKVFLRSERDAEKWRDRSYGQDRAQSNMAGDSVCWSVLSMFKRTRGGLLNFEASK
jgi:hypothetical protein